MVRIVGEITLTETKVFIHKLKMWLEDVIRRRALNWRWKDISSDPPLRRLATRHKVSSFPHSIMIDADPIHRCRKISV